MRPCEGCVHEVLTDQPIPDCRAHPKQAIGFFWVGAGRQLDAPIITLTNIENWAKVFAFPPANARCGDFVHKV